MTHAKAEPKEMYLLPAEEVLDTFGADPACGLCPDQVEVNRAQYGANTLERAQKESLGRRLFDAASEPMILMLIFAGIIALGVNIMHAVMGTKADFLECVGIFLAISLSVIITVVMEGRSAKAFEALSKINEDVVVRVLRDGKPQLIVQKDIVAGDILLVGSGDKLPADARIIESTALEVDESALTGESHTVKKDAHATFSRADTPIAERKNMLYSGSYVTSGNGKAVVTGVGHATEFGKIASDLSQISRTKTPLQERMNRLGKQIAILGIIAASVVFVIQLAIFIAHGTASVDTISEAFVTSIVLIVAAVPEGLPTIVAVSLSISIIKMSRENALVKKMIACETIGCVNVICSDKTGTLTQNRMTVGKIHTSDGWVEPGSLAGDLLVKNFCINSTADLGEVDANATFIGNPTECALLVAAHNAGHDYRTLRSHTDIVRVYPFDSVRKDMTTVIREGGELIALTKGSPEKILSYCDLSQDQRDRIERQITGCQENAARVLAFSHKVLDEEDEQDLKTQMHFDGFVAISDPLRPEVFDSVKECAKAGVGVKMLTGDNLVTAQAIANELGLLDEAGSIAIEASELESLSDDELMAMLPSIHVIARSTPQTKMRVVNLLKASGDIVAVTGDGINDAPALKNADVGIAMGISGTEVSKEASDIVLLDDSFSTIEKAIRWGRGIYQNFQRFIQFQLTVNLSSVIVVLASILTGFASPFTALQLLWINIVMDGPPALTLGLEPITDDLMKEKPVRRDANIVTRRMLALIGTSGVYISVVFMVQHFYNFLGATAAQMPTVLFTLFVLFQLFNAFNCREFFGGESIFKHFLNNRLMLGVFAFTFTLQVLIVQFGGAFFRTVALPWDLWVKMILIAPTVILLQEAVKLVARKTASKEEARVLG